MVVGGSIAGISCAHALIEAGWDVVVLEKTSSPPNGCATGAGVGLDMVSVKLIEKWSQQPQLLQQLSLPMTIEHVGEVFLQSNLHTLCQNGYKIFDNGTFSEKIKEILNLRNQNFCLPFPEKSQSLQYEVFAVL